MHVSPRRTELTQTASLRRDGKQGAVDDGCRFPRGAQRWGRRHLSAAGSAKACSTRCACRVCDVARGPRAEREVGRWAGDASADATSMAAEEALRDIAQTLRKQRELHARTLVRARARARPPPWAHVPSPSPTSPRVCRHPHPLHLVCAVSLTHFTSCVPSPSPTSIARFTRRAARCFCVLADEQCEGLRAAVAALERMGI
jgi:hypothetical protein